MLVKHSDTCSTTLFWLCDLYFFKFKKFVILCVFYFSDDLYAIINLPYIVKNRGFCTFFFFYQIPNIYHHGFTVMAHVYVSCDPLGSSVSAWAMILLEPCSSVPGDIMQCWLTVLERIMDETAEQNWVSRWLYDLDKQEVVKRAL